MYHILRIVNSGKSMIRTIAIVNCVGSLLLLLRGYQDIGDVPMLKCSPSSSPLKAYLMHVILFVVLSR